MSAIARMMIWCSAVSALVIVLLVGAGYLIGRAS